MAGAPPPPPPPAMNFGAPSGGGPPAAPALGSALLGDITKGRKLRKAVTNDRSAPNVGGRILDGPVASSGGGNRTGGAPPVPSQASIAKVTPAAPSATDIDMSSQVASNPLMAELLGGAHLRHKGSRRTQLSAQPSASASNVLASNLPHSSSGSGPMGRVPAGAPPVPGSAQAPATAAARVPTQMPHPPPFGAPSGAYSAPVLSSAPPPPPPPQPSFAPQIPTGGAPKLPGTLHNVSTAIPHISSQVPPMTPPMPAPGIPSEAGASVRPSAVPSGSSALPSRDTPGAPAVPTLSAGHTARLPFLEHNNRPQAETSTFPGAPSVPLDLAPSRPRQRPTSAPVPPPAAKPKPAVKPKPALKPKPSTASKPHLNVSNGSRHAESRDADDLVDGDRFQLPVLRSRGARTQDNGSGAHSKIGSASIVSSKSTASVSSLSGHSNRNSNASSLHVPSGSVKNLSAQFASAVQEASSGDRQISNTRTSSRSVSENATPHRSSGSLHLSGTPTPVPVAPSAPSTNTRTMPVPTPPIPGSFPAASDQPSGRNPLPSGFAPPIPSSAAPKNVLPIAKNSENEGHLSRSGPPERAPPIPDIPPPKTNFKASPSHQAAPQPQSLSSNSIIPTGGAPPVPNGSAVVPLPGMAGIAPPPPKHRSPPQTEALQAPSAPSAPSAAFGSTPPVPGPMLNSISASMPASVPASVPQTAPPVKPPSSASTVLPPPPPPPSTTPFSPPSSSPLPPPHPSMTTVVPNPPSTAPPLSVGPRVNSASFKINGDTSRKLVIDDSRFQFRERDELPAPRMVPRSHFETTVRKYPSGRGATVPLNLSLYN